MNREIKPTETCGHLIGVISDTHGRLPHAAIEALSGTDMIIHAGDIDSPDILEKLTMVSPTRAVKGNMDFGAWTQNLKEAQTITIGEISIYVRHILQQSVPLSADVQVVIYGHTHRPSIETHDGVLYLNPGSAGQRRHGHPLSVARLSIEGRVIHPEIFPLNT